ncbi:aminotransferase class V-fold PLP-dependent enzyme [Amycolatopsis sp. NPDC006131]|uniref:pyridoxal phosphate-dependent decarboxylase family protein n=1 Tax=Amycolatopsis sp. NPDC006131 TaxID=3156731 RepID=UPI0033BE54F8
MADDLLPRAAALGRDFRAGLDERPVFPRDLDPDAVRAALGELPDGPTDPAAVLDQLREAVEPALVASAGPRYFGFVTGGSLEAAAAADVLTTAWDQNGFNALTSPAAALVEEVAGGWLKDLLGLPPTASFGFVTGAQGGNTVGLAAARHAVLERHGWDVERQGLHGAPRVRIVAGSGRHATIDRALRLLGFGTDALAEVPTAPSGSIDVAALAGALSTSDAPTIVCLQAGEVNTGAFDDFRTAIAAAHARGAWVHVDGAFGLWAAASPRLRHLTEGVAEADSWATDGHKWLNVPYDSGYAFCAHPAAHAAATSYTAAYLVGDRPEALRSPGDFVPDSSRRARGFTTWAALRQLGRAGVAELVERSCALARRFAARLSEGGAEVVNDVVLNQVLVGFGDDTPQVLEAVQRSGECWMGGTVWQGRRLMRVSVSNWRTTEADVDRSVAAILAAWREVQGR